MELFEELSVPTPTPAASTDLVLDEDYPPVAPENGYGAPQPPQTRNPMTPRSTFDVVKSKPQYMVFVKATRNNTTTTLTKPNGDPIITLSGGKVGFKSSNRASYEAGYQCIVGIFKQLELEMNKGDLEWQLYLKGFGQGRDAAYRALIAAEGTTVKQFLTSVTDRSPIKIGEVRLCHQQHAVNAYRRHGTASHLSPLCSLILPLSLFSLHLPSIVITTSALIRRHLILSIRPAPYPLMSAAAPLSGVLPLPPAREIPSTFAASLRSWWAAGEKEGAASEERLLRKLPFFRPAGSLPSTPDDDMHIVAQSSRVELNNPKHYLNTLSMTATSASKASPPPAVLLHGYGAGLGFFYQNFPSLGRWAGKRGTSVYAIDWLGMGRSARVPFTVKSKREDIDGRVHEAESFFVDSLEEWRQKMGLETMTLIGHSLGGYLSVVYALRYPSRVSKLILLSPAGVPRDPNTTEPSREVTDSQATGASDDDHAESATQGRVQDLKSEQQSEQRKETRARKLFTYLWEEGWSPFQVVRSTVFWGPMLVGKYSTRRFIGLSEEDTRAMHDYIVNITLAKGSGEYCISHLLAPGAHARRPIVDRISALKIPITFVYGDHDWMDPDGGAESVESLRQSGNGHGRMYIVPHAGHHVYLDNPKAVNDLLVKELDRPLVTA
ncbi:putative cardiolipin-specific deacylase, mitochondrial [Grifola frondosa]|uniref:Putative cardiolipin-specific deacylase, mitochondrial n=1 Tax=Grifola frondosa TaxID=5627 RepID=A0A1C7MIN6_GRIFR|nr:putative cardiolipin-specific deacylase, mitochondrial [Grifola frondosa]